jgi:hypothetical protein
MQLKFAVARFHGASASAAARASTGLGNTAIAARDQGETLSLGERRNFLSHHSHNFGFGPCAPLGYTQTLSSNPENGYYSWRAILLPSGRFLR